MGSNADLPVSIGFDVDFNDGTSVYTLVLLLLVQWDTATWDELHGVVSTNTKSMEKCCRYWLERSNKNTNKYNCSIY